MGNGDENHLNVHASYFIIVSFVSDFLCHFHICLYWGNTQMSKIFILVEKNNKTLIAMSEKINFPILQDIEETDLDDNGGNNDQEGDIADNQNDDTTCTISNSIPPRPKRPLTSYNLFAILERAYILQNANKSTIPKLHPDDIDDTAYLRPPKYRDLILPKKWFDTRNKPKKSGNKKFRQLHGVISFVDLTKTVSKRWRELDQNSKSYFVDLAGKLVREYDVEVKEFTDKYGHHAGRSKTKSEKKAKHTRIEPGDKSNPNSVLIALIDDESKSAKPAVSTKTSRPNSARGGLCASPRTNIKASGLILEHRSGANTNHHSEAETEKTRIALDFCGNKKAPGRPCNAFNLFFKLEKNFILQTRYRDTSPLSVGSILAKGEEVDNTDSSTRPSKYANIIVPKNWFLEDTADFDWIKQKNRLLPDLHAIITENWENLDTESRSYFTNVASFLENKYEEKIAELNARGVIPHTEGGRKRIDNVHSLVEMDNEGECGIDSNRSDLESRVSYFAPQHRYLRPTYTTTNTACVSTALVPPDATMPYMHMNQPIGSNKIASELSSATRVRPNVSIGLSRAMDHANHPMYTLQDHRIDQYEMPHSRTQMTQSQHHSQNHLKLEVMYNCNVANIRPFANNRSNRVPYPNAMHGTVQVGCEERVKHNIDDARKLCSSVVNDDAALGKYNDLSTRPKSPSAGVEPQSFLSKLSTNVNSNFPWTDDEDSILFDLYKIYGDDWAVISCLLAGRTEMEVRNRWLYVVRNQKFSIGQPSERPDIETDEKSFSDKSLPRLHSTQNPKNTTQPLFTASIGVVNTGCNPSSNSTKRKYCEVENSRFADADDESDATQVFNVSLNVSANTLTGRGRTTLETNQDDLDIKRAKLKNELPSRECLRDIIKSFSVLKKRI